jgi:flagellar basal-body rod protein FlgG
VLDALWTAASGMLAQQIGLDVIANNLANVNTVGYKGQRAAFEDLLYNNISTNQGATQGQQMGLGVAISGIQAQFDEGAAQTTGVPTDFMITQGAGFFAVRKADGTTAYTRAGNFGIDADSQLVTQSGDLVLDSAGRPIQFPKTMKSLEIDNTGNLIAVTQTGRQRVAQLGMVTFTNPGGLTLNGGNEYLESADSGAPTRAVSGGVGGKFVQGVLEMANVKAVDEMVNMITTQRAYESVSKVVQASDEMLGTANGLRR